MPNYGQQDQQNAQQGFQPTPAPDVHGARQAQRAGEAGGQSQSTAGWGSGLLGAYGAAKGLQGLRSAGGMWGGAKAGARFLGRAAPAAGRLAGGPANLVAGVGNAGFYAALGDKPDQAGWHDASNYLGGKLRSVPWAGPALGFGWDVLPGNAMRFGENLGGAAISGTQAALGNKQEQAFWNAPKFGWEGPGGATAAPPNRGAEEYAARGGAMTYKEDQARLAKEYGPQEIARRDAESGSAFRSAGAQPSMQHMAQQAQMRLQGGGQPPNVPPALLGRQAATGNASLAPHQADSPLVTGQSDPLESLLYRQLQQSQNPQNYVGGGPSTSFSVAGPVDPTGLGSTPMGKLMGFTSTQVPQQPVFPPSPGGAAHAMQGDQQNAIHNLLALRGGQAQMVGAQGEMEKARAISSAAAMQSSPWYQELQHGEPPGSARMRQMLQGAPGLGQHYQNPNLAPGQLAQYEQSLPEDQRGLAHPAIAEILRQRQLSDPGWIQGFAEPDLLSRALNWGFDRPIPPEFAQRKQWLGSYGYK